MADEEKSIVQRVQEELGELVGPGTLPALMAAAEKLAKGKDESKPPEKKKPEIRRGRIMRLSATRQKVTVLHAAADESGEHLVILRRSGKKKKVRSDELEPLHSVK